MGATITVREVIKQASVLLQDTVPQFSRQPEAEMVDWLNEGQLFIASMLPLASSGIYSIKLAAGSLQSIEAIPAADVIPADGSTLSAPLYGTQVLRLICNMGASGTAAGAPIRLVPIEVKDSQNPTWRSVAKAYVDEYCYDPSTPKQFENSPAVTGTVWVRAALNVQPIRVPNTGTPGSELYAASGSNATKISLADEYAQMLVNLIVARSNMRETEWADRNKADYFSSLVLGQLNAKVAAITGNNPNLRTLPFAPQPVGQAA